MQKVTKLGCIVACLLLLPALLLAQGVTNAALNGTVMDNKGQPVPGANVVAVHGPSGSVFGAATREDGRFNIPGARVGGPYTITASHIGHRAQKQENVFLALGQDLKIAFVIAEEAVELGETVTVAERYQILSAARTGAATNISSTELKTLPTLVRGISDFARLTPQSSSSGPFPNSFAGRNNLYNNISIDGSVLNNVFGLASEVGGQTNSQPISLDAIEEIQVSLAPYDVREGSFTGANISVITKAGTNRLQGSAYYFGRNESFISDRVGHADVTNPDFKKKTMGLRLGGPVLRDRAFLFANAELGRREDPGSLFRATHTAGETGPDISSVKSSDLDNLRNFLLNPGARLNPAQSWKFDPGVYENYFLDNNSDNVTARFDLNLNQTNRLTIRYNYLKSFRDTPLSNSGATGGRQPSSTRLPFSGSNYLINNNAHSIIGQLNSAFGSRFSNQFVVGYTSLRDFREGKTDPFPLVDIENGNNQTIMTFGYEPFTPNNKLDSDIFQVSDNFSAYFGKHTITLGTAHEAYSFSNGFTPDFYSRYRFRTLQEFIDHVNNTPRFDTNNDGVLDLAPQPTVFSLQYSAVKGVEVPFAEISALQASVYAQDEFQMSSKLKLTFGVRADVPIFTKDLQANATVAGLTFANGEKIDVSKLPDATPLWSPRLGFNWDAKGDRSLQIRGGTGVFTGKIPFVWLSNQASNNGILFNTTLLTAPTATAGRSVLRDPTTGKNIVFTPDYKTYIPTNPSAPTTVLINATTNDFKFPQVFRNNLALDMQLPSGFIGTLEGIYSKDLNAVFHRNANLTAPVGNFAGPDNRARYGGTTALNRVNASVTNAIILDNTDKGYQYSLTGQLTKRFNDGFANMSYTYSRARDLTSSPSAIAATAWSSNQTVNGPNTPSLGFAQNDQRHHIVATAAYRLNYLGLAGTSLSLIYVGGTGFTYSYAYAGDMNGDQLSGNDLIYIPAKQSDIVLAQITGDTRTVDQLWQQLDYFIGQDPYLRKHRGEYAERGAATVPWLERLDLSLKHEFNVNVSGQRNAVEVSFDIINLGNLIDSNRGLVKTPNQTQFLSFSRYDAATNKPVFTFPLFNGRPLSKTFRTDATLASRWQAQFSVRYSFN